MSSPRARHGRSEVAMGGVGPRRRPRQRRRGPAKLSAEQRDRDALQGPRYGHYGKIAPRMRKQVVPLTPRPPDLRARSFNQPCDRRFGCVELVEPRAKGAAQTFNRYLKSRRSESNDGRR